MQALPYENQTANSAISIKAKVKKIVDCCFLINLDRRDDRLREWLSQLPDPWPFAQPARL